MDASLCLKAGIHGITAPPIDAAGNVELRPSAAAAEKPSMSKNFSWGFTFRGSLWPGSKIRLEPGIAVDDAVLAEKDEIAERANQNWISRVVGFDSISRKEVSVESEEEGENCVEEEEENGECDVCRVDDAETEFDRESFSKLLRKVPLAESRLYAQLSYLGSLAYCIPQIKAGNLLRDYGFTYVSSSLEKKEMAMKKSEAEDEETNNSGGVEGNRISSAAYQMVASAASYFDSHIRSKSENSVEDDNVMAAVEEVKQAVADDLSSTLSSPCDWYINDDHPNSTRFFVIQGSESLASWKANLLFEPIKFEGQEVVVHRGIYEAAKGIYEDMLPEIHSHLNTHGDGAKFRFTGHSLGGSLSVLLNLMLLIRGGAPRSSLLPVITYGAPAIMCGGDRLLHKLGLPRNHVRSITMHRDIVPRAFSCNYPAHVTEFLKAVNAHFRNHPCLDNQKLLYTPMGEFLILQPDDKFSPNHDLLPPGSGLYLLTSEAARVAFLNSPHPLEILSDRSAYGSHGSIQKHHDMLSYFNSVTSVIQMARTRAQHAGGLIVSRIPFDLVRTGRRSFESLLASQHVHLLLLLMFPARLVVFPNCGSIIT